MNSHRIVATVVRTLLSLLVVALSVGFVFCPGRLWTSPHYDNYMFTITRPAPEWRSFAHDFTLFIGGVLLNLFFALLIEIFIIWRSRRWHKQSVLLAFKLLCVFNLWKVTAAYVYFRLGDYVRFLVDADFKTWDDHNPGPYHFEWTYIWDTMSYFQAVFDTPALFLVRLGGGNISLLLYSFGLAFLLFSGAEKCAAFLRASYLRVHDWTTRSTQTTA